MLRSELNEYMTSIQAKAISFPDLFVSVGWKNVFSFILCTISGQWRRAEASDYWGNHSVPRSHSAWNFLHVLQ